MRELLLGGIAAAILLLALTVWLIARRRRARHVTRAGNTLDVIPLPAPPVLPPREAAPVYPPRVIIDDDIEGKTVPAPMTNEEAYSMHARYAPAFDQQLAIARHIDRHGDAEISEPEMPDFDQGRYANALQYADAFEQQLARQRRTQLYAAIAGPRRVARGSAPPRRAEIQRSDHSDPSQWDNKTVLGVKPVKPAK